MIEFPYNLIKNTNFILTETDSLILPMHIGVEHASGKFAIDLIKENIIEKTDFKLFKNRINISKVNLRNSLMNTSLSDASRVSSDSTRIATKVNLLK